MRKHLKIGLVVPFATDKVPVEGPLMYPEVTFIPKGVGVRALTPEGYDAAFDAILPAARELAARGDLDAITVIGTSLTFYRGYDAHQALLEQLRKETGLPVSTMSEAVVHGLRSVGARKIAVATAYSDLVNDRLTDFLRQAGFEVSSMKGFGILEFGGAERMTEQDIIDLAGKSIGEAKVADAVLISCGGLMTLNCAVPIEQKHGIPVVTSTQSSFWKALRLAGDSGQISGYGQMLGQSQAVPA
jgi:arylmalonate decarboxylase